MGLDMYLDRYPRYRGVTVQQIDALESYFGWLERPAAYADCSFNKWCGVDDSALPDADAVSYYQKLYVPHYYAWDDEHRYPHCMLHEPVGYWRKANAIHKWFVDHVQDGVDDCLLHHEVSPSLLMELRELCRDVVENCPLVAGQVKNGERYQNGKWETIWGPGKLVMNPEYAEYRLPVASGFFFGSTEYNEWYISDLIDTIKICDQALAETDFNTHMLYYCSSW